MAIHGYLAMTAAEFREYPSNGSKIAWMACHFSPYGTGISNCPASLPEESMLILNDRTPICGHDPQRIAEQLVQLADSLKCACVLLDFQRPGVPETAELAEFLQRTLPCPTAVSDVYARSGELPVFLPPVPPDIPIGEYLSPWQGREIWLEAALPGCVVELTEDGARKKPLEEVPAEGYWDETLCCHYRITVGETAIFSLYRTPEDLKLLLRRAEALGVTRTVGLYQELGAMEL